MLLFHYSWVVLLYLFLLILSILLIFLFLTIEWNYLILFNKRIKIFDNILIMSWRYKKFDKFLEIFIRRSPFNLLNRSHKKQKHIPKIILFINNIKYNCIRIEEMLIFNQFHWKFHIKSDQSKLFLLFANLAVVVFWCKLEFSVYALKCVDLHFY